MLTPNLTKKEKDRIIAWAHKEAIESYKRLVAQGKAEPLPDEMIPAVMV